MNMQLSQSSSQYVLFYQGRYYQFNKAQMVIGSDPRCDIPIENNPRVLPQHAWLTLLDGKVFLQHHESNALIWVNGVRVTEVQLQDRAEIAIGSPETRLTLLLNRAPTGQMEFAATGTLSHMGGLKAATASAPHPAVPNVANSASLAPNVAQMASSAMPAAAAISSTDTTRFLCAGGHLSEDFQKLVTRDVIYEDHRAMGETYGVDMLAVVSWCKSGIRRINIRDAVLLGIFLLICLFVLMSVFQSVGAITTPPTQSGSPYGSQSGNPYGSPYGSQPGSPYGSPYGSGTGSVLSPQAGLMQGLVALAAAVGFLITLVIFYIIERLIKRRWPRSHPGFLSLIVLLLMLLSSMVHPLLALILVLALPATIFVELCIRYYGDGTQRLSKGEFERNLIPVPLDADLTNKLKESFTTQQRNVVVYSGRDPFVGAGYYLDGRSFVVDTAKGAQSQLLQSDRDEPQPFALSELYATVSQALEGQGLSDVLEVEEKLYVNGKYLSENPPFFNKEALRPVPRVDQNCVDYFKEHPTEDVRYYQCIRFNAWRGEVIFTAFLRFVRRGKNLFTEIDYLLLPPLMRELHWVDEKESVPTFGKLWELFARTFDSPIKLCFGLPVRFLRDLGYRRQQERLARIARNHPAFDYGATTSLRWAASDNDYHLFFQGLDKEMYLKIAEQELLEAIVQFLDERHIDTTELRQRQQTILNEGTIVSGGELNISGDNVQLGAKSTIKTGSKSRPVAGSRAAAPAKS